MKSRKLFSLLVGFCLVLTLMPVPTALAAEENDEPTYTTAVMPGSVTAFANATTARMTLQQLQAKFPAGKYWNGGNADSYTNSSCRCKHKASHKYGDANVSCECNTFDGAIQCYGFALKLGYDAYGTSPRNWRTTTSRSYVDSLKPGDIVDNSGSPYHTVFVIGVTDTDIVVGECNWGGDCLISWGRHIPKSAVKNYGTLKIYIAPSELPTPSAEPTQVELHIDTWVSEKGQNYQADQAPKATQFQVGKTYYFWFKLYDSISGKLLNQLYPSSSYNINMTVTDPNGERSEVNYSNSGYNWYRVSNAKAGTYTCKVTVSGSFNVGDTISFTIPDSAPASTAQVRADTLNTLNSAGTASLYPTVFKGYLRGTSKYDAYSDSSGTNYIGRIYTTDELKVQSVYSNNGVLWMSALCPWDGYSSERLIYAKLDAMVDTSFAPYTAIASSSATVYTRSNASTKYGSLGAGDAVTVVGQSGQYVQVIYPLAVGGYKIGWCSINSLSRPNISSVTARSSTSVRLSYTLPSNAANNLVILDTNMNVLVRGNISGSGVSLNNMAPGKTYYIYVESELSNGTGIVTSTVKRIVLK